MLASGGVAAQYQRSLRRVPPLGNRTVFLCEFTRSSRGGPSHVLRYAYEAVLLVVPVVSSSGV